MKKILLVEDDPNLGEVLNLQLEMNGYEVSLLRFPTETVENLLEDKFDLVIMDKLLNGIDGTLVCAAIRNTKPISGTPILMMSGLDGAGEDCIAAGANEFIAKPFEISRFLERIEATMENSQDLQN